MLVNSEINQLPLYLGGFFRRARTSGGGSSGSRIFRRTSGGGSRSGSRIFRRTSGGGSRSGSRIFRRNRSGTRTGGGSSGNNGGGIAIFSAPSSSIFHLVSTHFCKKWTSEIRIEMFKLVYAENFILSGFEILDFPFCSETT